MIAVNPMLGPKRFADLALVTVIPRRREAANPESRLVQIDRDPL